MDETKTDLAEKQRNLLQQLAHQDLNRTFEELVKQLRRTLEELVKQLRRTLDEVERARDDVAHDQPLGTYVTHVAQAWNEITWRHGQFGPLLERLERLVREAAILDQWQAESK